MALQKYLFIDRDGTLIESPPPGGQVDRFDKLRFFPFVITYLGLIARTLPYKLVMVSNQNGLGTAKMPEDDFYPVQNFVLQTLENEGIIFSDIIIDASLPDENSPLRKPRTGRMKKYLQVPDADIAGSFVIGDRLTDVQFAKNLGCKAIFVDPDNLRGAAEITDSAEDLKMHTVALATTSWKDVYEFLRSQTKPENDSL